MPILDQLLSRRTIPLRSFELVPLEFDEGCEAGELVLDQPVTHVAPSAPSAPCAVPTAGELRESIERHLCSAGGARRTDAADELRNALAELRRSLLPRL